jgi:Phosphodiester glycosidase
LTRPVRRLALSILLACAACSRSHATPVPDAAPAVSASAKRASSPLHVATRAVEGRKYLQIGASPSRLALRLERPKKSDPGVWLAVPGTYTSPDGGVEGAVVLEGHVVRSQANRWEALLVIDAKGGAEIRESKGVPRAALDALAKQGASALQGHLLVFDGTPRPLLPSPALRRRALVTTAAGTPSIVESLAPMELAAFARDLVALGATRAMNLDMGSWSEGWYRAEDGKIVPLGEDFRNTAKQTNWLVVLERS